MVIDSENGIGERNLYLCRICSRSFRANVLWKFIDLAIHSHVLIDKIVGHIGLSSLREGQF